MMGRIKFICALTASVVCALAFLRMADSSVLHFTPGSTKVSEGMVYRFYPGNDHYRMKRQTDEQFKPDLNALIPGIHVPSKYEEENSCRCLPFYNCCNESAIAGLCGETIDPRNNLDFTTNKACQVDYHECCPYFKLCGDDVACIARVSLIASPSSPLSPGGEPEAPLIDVTKPPGPDRGSSEGTDHPGEPTPELPVHPTPELPEHPTPEQPVHPVPESPQHPTPEQPVHPTPESPEQPIPPPPDTPSIEIPQTPLPPPPVTPPTREPPPPPPKCGVRNFDGVGIRLAGSAEVKRTQYGEFPWMVALLREDTIGRTAPADIYVAGGVLVSPSIVLTAAHSIHDHAKGDFHNLKVRLGEWDAMTDQEPYSQEDYRVRSIIIHPDFKPRIVLNDIAVLVLERPVEMHQHIAPICLPEEGEIELYQDNVQGCVVTGWGKDSFFGSFQNILKLIEIPTVRKESCEEKMRATRLGPAFRLHPSFLCAGGDGVDACKGDGGSPLVCPSIHAGKDPHEIRYVLTGLVSWGIGCAEVHPGIYANIPYLLPWILQFVKEYDPDYHYSSIESHSVTL